MKKLVLFLMIALVSSVQAAELSLADARRQIGAIAAQPATMTKVFSQLSAADQVTFLREINTAISKLGGSPSNKAALFIAVNERAMRSSKRGNLQNLLAEMFATVPPESLTAVNERFADTIFNRASDPEKTFTDEQYTNIATETMKKIIERNSGVSDSEVRNTFAIVMFLKASNGTPANLVDKLSQLLPDGEGKALAKNEWIPAATGEKPDYNPILGASDSGDAPDMVLVLQELGPESLTGVLSDLSSFDGMDGKSASFGAVDQFSTPQTFGAFGLDRKPRTTNRKAPWYTGSDGLREPEGYWGQRQ